MLLIALMRSEKSSMHWLRSSQQAIKEVAIVQHDLTTAAATDESTLRMLSA
jgi:hypothetical protein